MLQVLLCAFYFARKWEEPIFSQILMCIPLCVCTANTENTKTLLALIKPLHCRCICWNPLISHSLLMEGLSSLQCPPNSAVGCCKMIYFDLQLIPCQRVHILGIVQNINCTPLTTGSWPHVKIYCDTLQNNQWRLVKHNMHYLIDCNVMILSMHHIWLKD